MAPHLSGEKDTSFSPAETPPRERPYVADDNINNGSSDEQLPEDLRRLLDRAQADDSGQDVYDAILYGGDATGGTSGIVAAANPFATLEEMFAALDRVRIDISKEA